MKTKKLRTDVVIDMRVPIEADLHAVLTDEFYSPRYKKAKLTKRQRVTLDKVLDAMLNFVTK